MSYGHASQDYLGLRFIVNAFSNNGYKLDNLVQNEEFASFDVHVNQPDRKILWIKIKQEPILAGKITVPKVNKGNIWSATCSLRYADYFRESFSRAKAEMRPHTVSIDLIVGED